MDRRQLAVRSLAVLVMLVFLRASGRKLFGVEETALHFQEWGYPHWFMLLVATIELTGALMLPFLRTMRAGAVLLMPVMLGAIGTQLFHGAYAKAFAPAVVLLLLVFLATRRRVAGATSSAPVSGGKMGTAPCNT